MTLLLCAVLFCVPFVVASLPSVNDTHILALDAGDSLSCSDTRTLWDILLSCWLTLFACTWTAIHPDVPVAKDFNDALGGQRSQPHDDHRAVGQSESAISLLGDMSNSSKSSSARWTLTHGFFAWMGGFMLYVDGKPRATLTPNELLRFVCEGSVDMPVIAEEDIEDRSKGNVLSKLVAILQLVWFIIQLVARYAQNLPVTPLELDTLGIAALTCIAYGLWWKKPMNIGRPHIVHWNSGATTPPPRDGLVNETYSDLLASYVAKDITSGKMHLYPSEQKKTSALL
ncbi:hypothetical protein F4604DRAFT_1679496 [Suillus subluteus]|nr:hypothetical protein F4604DRAFT_1679496 [Suillus subluteus]